MGIDTIFILVLGIVIGYLFLVYKVEKMADVTQLTEDRVKELIYQTYSIDVAAIRNLSNVATKLQTDGLTVPGNLIVTGKIAAKGGVDGDLNVSGNINTGGNVSTGGNLSAKGGISGDIAVSGNLGVGGNLGVNGGINLVDGNTTLSKGSGNSLRVKTANGFVELGPQNNDWCHIYTDRPKFAFNRIITDVTSNPYKDYVRSNLPFRLDQMNSWNNGAANGPVKISDDFILKGYQGGGGNYTMPNWYNFSIIQ